MECRLTGSNSTGHLSFPLPLGKEATFASKLIPAQNIQRVSASNYKVAFDGHCCFLNFGSLSHFYVKPRAFQIFRGHRVVNPKVEPEYLLELQLSSSQ